MAKAPEKIMVTRKTLRLIDRLDSAAQEYAFLGSYHPDDHYRIERRYERARTDLARYIAEIERRAGVQMP